MNEVELTVSGSMSLDGPKDETVRVKVINIPPLSVITENSHLRKVSVVEHVTSS